MTRKHYKLLAEAFARLRQRVKDDWWDGIGEDESNKVLAIIEDIEDEVCLVLQDDNPSFSHHKFTTTSGRTD